ncbi:MAG: hypothetical protein KatS3mg126_0184 [Lysobacteraceae bacterium]|nr:MAG: hypothetical protein KatS3mg126_0184 [Xanthomonadaceae bacterium]
MQVIYQAEHLIDAHLLRGRLEAVGIPAWVRGEWLTGAMGELPVQGLLAVCVEDRDLDAALRWIRRWQEEDAAAPEGADPTGEHWLRA